MNAKTDYQDLLASSRAKAREGALEEAVHLAEEAVAASLPDREGHLARLDLACLLAEVGEFDRAEALTEAASSFREKNNDDFLHARIHAVSAQISEGLGKFDNAVDLFRNALFKLGGGGSAKWKVRWTIGLASALREKGDFESAGKEAARARRDASALGDPYLLGMATAAALRAGAAGAEEALLALLEKGPAPPPVEWFSRFALAESKASRGDDKGAEREFAGALKGLRSIWGNMTPRRRATYLSTASLRRFCFHLVARVGEGPGFEGEGTVVREIHRQVLEEAEGVELQGIEEVIQEVGDSKLSARLETFRTNYRNLMRLQEVIKAVNSEPHLDRLLTLIMDHAVEIAGAERGFMMLLEGEDLEFRVARNLDQEKVRRPEFKISKSIAEEAFRTGKAILTANAKEDPRFAGAGSVHELKLTSVLCLPLRIRELVTGVIYVDNRFRVGQFTPDILRLLEMFSDQAAIALENARLHDENRCSKEELLKLNRKLSDLNARLSMRVREQGEALDRVRMEGPIPEEPRRYGPLVSRSAAMEAVFRLLDKVVASDVPVMIQGKSGTGKELVARVIHEKSARAQKAFVSENCAAVTETLLESELFGHVRGAFTGAIADRMGLFEMADGGTLFLDEVGEMSPEMQKKLLRALEEGEIRPVGAKTTRKVDVRVISASNRNLRELVGNGIFREDLFFRLNVLKIDLPPLRDRVEDIPVLLDHFFGSGEKPVFEPKALRRIMRYGWPGNVREIRNFVDRIKALKVERITEADLLPEMLEEGADPLRGTDLSGTLLEMEERFMRSVILKALREAENNKTRAAEILGIPKTTLYNRMKRYGIADEA